MKRAAREWLYIRQNGTCAYCGKECALAGFNVDHVRPKSKGGNGSMKNLVGSCVECNQAKADQEGWRPRFVPGLGFLVED